ncbi:hypothetical protein PsYK624_114360 [Phanerochaete sordida]|uniref:FHA domain-containing protein n=1 Tax=Phanerochaete sordida TaxID=48140 RepID=A0A9P3GFW2_9APHY|nr:hypothetical protein PsYK624_114360 [Phanerochaete sordida]
MASTTSTMRNSPPRDITGIALSVEKYGDEPPQVLTFYKQDTDIILIGRRSSVSTKPQADETDRALFRCPVISRRHARIMFTQYGNVYLSDLSSHHGTHILRPGEKASTMIKADTPSVLADGDTITFGKVVGREDSIVRPIIAKVRLLFGAPASPSSESTSSQAPTTPAAPTAALHTSSGRYGIYTPAMTSSSSDSSESEEVEEISAPSQAARPCAPFTFAFGPRASQAHQMHHVFHTRHAHHTQMVPNAPGRLSLLRRILPRVGSIGSFEEVTTGHGSSRLSPISVSSVSRSPSIVEMSREDVQREQADQQPSRAASPGEDMDLESDAPSEYPSKAVPGDIEVVHGFDGLLPILAASSRLCTPEPEHALEMAALVDFPEHQVESDDSDSDLYATPAPQRAPEPLEFAPAASESEFVEFNSPEGYATPLLDPMEAILDFSSIPWRFATASSRGASPLPAREQQPFDTRVERLKDRLAELEQRMLGSSKAGSAEPASDVEAEPAHSEESIAPQEHEAAAKEDVAPMVKSLKEMLQSLDELRKKAEADMTRELDAIRALRAEAEAAATAALAHAVAPAPDFTADEDNMEVDTQSPAATFNALKRKRNALDDEGGDAPEAPSAEIADVLDATVLRADLASVGRAPACHALFDRLASPPRKRARTVDVARRIAVTVAKTTAIAAVGAVATWSALAYY